VLLLALSRRLLFPEPGAASELGVNAVVTPAGNPVTENATGASNPPLTATSKVTLLFEPAVTETEAAADTT
jgi:hypothetical protein